LKSIVQQAVAIATFAAGAAHAQSAVNVSGQFDVSVGYTQPIRQSGTSSMASGNSGPNHLLFSGVEQIAPGLDVMFRLDSAFAANTGQVGPVLWGRESVAGIRLSGASATFGRNVNPFYDTVIAANVFGESRMAPLFAVVGYTTSHPIRINAAPADGLSASVLYRFKQDVDSRYYSGNVEYRSASGANVFRLAADHSIPDKGEGPLTSLMWGGSFDLRLARVQLAFARQRDTSAQQKSRGAEVGVLVPLSAGAVRAAAAVGEKSRLDGTNSSTIRAFALGYEYALSKRSALYLIANRQHVEILGNGRALVAGMRHAF
jgi:predicted porin